MKILVVTAEYYPDISKNLKQGACLALKKRSEKITKIDVPGIFEIPVVIAKNITEYDAFVALGCIIKGKTIHFDLISKSVINSIMKLSINYKKPIGNGIISCLNKKQAIARSEPVGDYIKFNGINRGIEAANAVLKVLNKF